MAIINLIEKNNLEGANRVDAEYYQPIYFEVEKKLERVGYKTIDGEFKVVNFGAYSLCNYIYYIEEGIPFLNVKNIKDNYFDLTNLKFITIEVHELLKKSKVYPKQILLTMAGTIGVSAVAHDLPMETNSNQAIANVTVNEELFSPYYVSTFLNSKYGRLQTKRLVVSNVQPNLLLIQIKRIKIPLLNKSFQKYIENLVIKGLDDLKIADNKYMKIQKLLVEEIFNNNSIVDNSLIYESDLSNCMENNRFDSEYYHPKYEKIVDVIKNYKNGWSLVKNIINIKDEKFVPENEIEYRYIELANINNSGEIIDITEEKGECLPTRARRIVNQGDVIVSSIEGSLNSIALITSKFDGSLCSTGFYVLNSNKINSETLFVLMKSKPYQELLARGCSGTILTSLTKNEFLKIPIPHVDEEMQKVIKTQINEFYSLKQASKNYFNIAKKGVELAIEQDEQIAEEWINQELNKLGIA